MRTKHIFQFAIATSLLTLAGCAAPNNGLYNGENLLLPIEKIPENWQKSVNPDDKAMLLENPDKGFADSLHVRVMRNFKDDLSSFQSLLDAPGRKSCKDFASTNIPNKITHYPALTWDTSCETASGSNAAMKHLIIKGNDSFYHLQKIWKYQPTAEEQALWQEIFDGVTVCDTRSTSNPCPELRKVTPTP